MKIVKPLRLGFFFRTFEHRRQHYLVTTLFACFPFDEPERLLPEADMWLVLSEELGRFGMFDQGMWKKRGEVLVIGHAYPKERPSPHCEVRLTFGSIDKQLYVFGDRHWTTTGPTDPRPFEQMPLSYERAFGGASFDDNPKGVGAELIEVDGRKVRPLPNVEHPKRLVRSERDRPAPASFAPEDFTLPKRFKRMGTYDAAWRKQRFPGLADDVDWDVFNVAPRDQQLEGFFRGDESFELCNMHPDRPIMRSRLPNLEGRCLLSRGDADALEDVSMRLETVLLVPHAAIGVCVYRGTVPVESEDVYEIAHCIAALEQRGGPRRPRDHYAEALRLRLDRDKAHIYFLRDRDFLPRAVPSAPEGGSDLDAFGAAVRPKGLAAENQRRRLDRELEALKERMRAAGFAEEEIDQASKVDMPGEPPTLDTLPEYVEKLERDRERLMAEQQEEKRKMEERLRRRAEELGIDYDAVASEEAGGGPPDFSAEAQLARLSEVCAASRRAGQPMEELEAQLSDPRYEAQLRQLEEQLLSLYRSSAHNQPPAPLPDAAASTLARQRVIITRDAAESLRRADLTGVDLSGLDLSGADLTEALLERANLAGADLSGALLEGAVLSRADLRGAKLAQARLVRANWGRADLRGADLSGADLSESVADEADLRGARLDGARLSLAMIGGVQVEGASLEGVVAWRMFFKDTDLRGSIWKGADLEECSFLGVDLGEVDFSGAKMRSCTLLGARAEGARFVDADLGNFRAVLETNLRGADFSRARLEGANFRGADLAGARFDDAVARQSDFSEASLAAASFEGADVTGCYFVRTELGGARLARLRGINAVFRRAKLHGASFRGANLFAADFSRAVGDDATTFEGALVERVVRLEAP